MPGHTIYYSSSQGPPLHSLAPRQDFIPSRTPPNPGGSYYQTQAVFWVQLNTLSPVELKWRPKVQLSSMGDQRIGKNRLLNTLTVKQAACTLMLSSASFSTLKWRGCQALCCKIICEEQQRSCVNSPGCRTWNMRKSGYYKTQTQSPASETLASVQDTGECYATMRPDKFFISATMWMEWEKVLLNEVCPSAKDK